MARKQCDGVGLLDACRPARSKHLSHLGLRAQKRGAAPLYNATPYEGEGGRGWCVVEQGSSTVVAAHLAKAKGSGRGLVEQYQRAEAARPKVIDITNGGVAEPRLIEEDPMALLDRTMDELGKARFTFPSDKTMAVEMMQKFEWTIKTAMEEAELALNAAELTVDPAIERRERSNARKGPRPSTKKLEAPSVRLLYEKSGIDGDTDGVELADQGVV